MNMQQRGQTRRTLLKQVIDQCHPYPKATTTGDRDPMNQLLVLIRRLKGELNQQMR